MCQCGSLVVGTHDAALPPHLTQSRGVHSPRHACHSCSAQLVTATLPCAHTPQGFEFYDTMTSSLLSNITFDNYRFRQFTTNPADWWYLQGPSAFRMLSHSDQFKVRDEFHAVRH
jgi:hypothetical protein